jgi:hypothetical protein
MRIQTAIRGGLGLCCLGLGMAWVPTAHAQSGSSGSSFSIQPMFVPMMTTNGQSTPLNPYMAMSAPLMNPYGTTTNNGMGMTNQQMGLMMLTTPGRMGGLGSGQLSGVHPNPNAPKSTQGRMQALASAERDPSAVRRATQPAGSASRYFSRQSATQKSEPRGKFDRQARYFP